MCSKQKTPSSLKWIHLPNHHFHFIMQRAEIWCLRGFVRQTWLQLINTAAADKKINCKEIRRGTPLITVSAGTQTAPKYNVKITSLVAEWSRGDKTLDLIMQSSNTKRDTLSQISPFNSSDLSRPQLCNEVSYVLWKKKMREGDYVTNLCGKY